MHQSMVDVLQYDGYGMIGGLHCSVRKIRLSRTCGFITCCMFYLMADIATLSCELWRTESDAVQKTSCEVGPGKRLRRGQAECLPWSKRPTLVNINTGPTDAPPNRNHFNPPLCTTGPQQRIPFQDCYSLATFSKQSSRMLLLSGRLDKTKLAGPRTQWPHDSVHN